MLLFPLLFSHPCAAGVSRSPAAGGCAGAWRLGRAEPALRCSSRTAKCFTAVVYGPGQGEDAEVARAAGCQVVFILPSVRERG